MDTFMPGSAILPLPTTRSSYWRPLASLCILPVPGRPGSAGAAGLVSVVDGTTVAEVVVLDSLIVPVFSVLSLQPAAPSASIMPRAKYSFDIRDSFFRWEGSGNLAYCNHLRNPLPMLRIAPQGGTRRGR